jgi:hypothetical protein
MIELQRKSFKINITLIEYIISTKIPQIPLYLTLNVNFLFYGHIFSDINFTVIFR